MTDEENQRLDRMTFTVPQAVLELHAGLFLDKLERVNDMITKGLSQDSGHSESPKSPPSGTTHE